MADELRLYLNENGLGRILDNLEQNLAIDDEHTRENMYELAQDHVEIIQHFLAYFDPNEGGQISEINRMLQQLYQILFSYVENYGPLAINNEGRNPRGRPCLRINTDQVNGLKRLGFSWEKIAHLIGISERTLRRRRRVNEGDFVSTRTAISDDDLTAVVREIINSSPNSGERMITGAVKSRHISVQRWRVREAIRRVDPIGVHLRRLRRTIFRRVYQVPGPNSLWHIDGNHKLINWRIVIHGAIDGFSRLIVFLNCSSNNEAATVHSSFLNAVQQYQCPKRIRTDHGTENIDVARWMLEHHGIDKHPVITGLSVHNQRIERLWVDVYTYVINHFRNVFMYLEQIRLLDRNDEIDLYALHYVFLPRVQHSLDEFMSSWNSHPLSTERSYSPLQVWINGMYRQINENERGAAEFFDTPNVDWEFYGIDEEGPAEQIQTNNNVQVPRSFVQLNAEELLVLETCINPQALDENFGVTVYANCRELLHLLLTQLNN